MKDPGFCIGETLELTKDYKGENLVKTGERFIIRDFPSCVRKVGTQFNYFLYGKTKDGRHCRAFIEEVKKISNETKDKDSD